MRKHPSFQRALRQSSKCIALAAGLTLANSALGQVGQITEDFDTNPAARGWVGQDNRTAPQNYGWSGDDPLVTGTHTGGAPGEMGGTIVRVAPPPTSPANYYGVPIPSGFDLGDTPFLIIKCTVNLEQSGGAANLGWGTGVSSYFSSGNGNAKDFVGISFDNGNNLGGVVWSATGGRTLNQTPPDLTTGKTSQVVMVYDTNGFGGHGRIDISVDGVGKGMDLGANTKFGPSTLTTFQLMGTPAAGSTDKEWFDDLSYTNPAATDPSMTIWKTDVVGQFTDGANWTNGVPNGIDATANMLAAASASHTIFMDNAVTLGTLRLGNSNTFNFAGDGSLTFQTSAGSAMVDQLMGTEKINVPSFIASDTVFNIYSGVLKISEPITVMSGKSLTQAGFGSVQYESLVSVQNNASITFGNTTYSPGLTLAAGARATVAAHGASASARVLHLDNLTMDATSRLDIADNGLALNYTGGSPIASIRSKVQTAFAAGWNGNGITSSTAQANFGGAHPTAIAIFEASALGVSTFLGEPVDSTTVLLRHTWQGDANVDGRVNALDFNALATSFGTSGGWIQGDFNYDGTVNTADFNAMAINFNQGPAFPGPALGALVPEPTSLGILLLGMSLSSRRRRD